MKLFQRVENVQKRAVQSTRGANLFCLLAGLAVRPEGLFDDEAKADAQQCHNRLAVVDVGARARSQVNKHVLKEAFVNCFSIYKDSRTI